MFLPWIEYFRIFNGNAPDLVRNIMYARSTINCHIVLFPVWIQKGGDLTQSYDKSPYTNRNVKRASDNTNNATKKFA